MDQRVFEILMAFIPVLGAIITGFVVPFIKEKIGLEKLAKYESWCKIAVKAADMIWVESGHGTDKKTYVVEFMNNMFNKNKTVITAEQLDALIEGAVKALHIEEGIINE